MKSLVALLLTLTMLLSPFVIYASDTAEQTSDGTESADTESSKAGSASTGDGAGEGKEEEEEPDCD